VIELCEQRRMDRVRSVHLNVLRMSAGLATGVAIVAVAFNEPFVRLWVGAQNFGGDLLTLTFALILIYRVIMQTAAMVVIGAGVIRGVVFMSIVEAALNLALSLWWVRRYGIVGVAAGTVVAGLCTSAWYVVRTVSATLQISVTEYVARGIAVPLACGIPAAAVALVIRRTSPVNSWLDIAAGGAAIAAVYALTFGWIGLTPGDRQEIYTRLRASALSRATLRSSDRERQGSPAGTRGLV
jgi:O-antigen/teichoic acid export membrane protein